MHNNRIFIKERGRFMFSFDNGILSDIASLKRGKAFENLYIYLTELCDYKCKHCYLGDRLCQYNVMSLEDVYSNLEAWRTVGSTKVCFIGGEPTLYPFLSKVINKAYSLGYETIILGSNGSQNALNVMKSLPLEQISYIQISLDGATPAINDFIRQPGAFQETMETIRFLVSLQVDVRIIMTVNSFNISEMIPMIELGDMAGVTLTKFHVMSEIGNAHESTLSSVHPTEWFLRCQEIENYASCHSLHTRISFQPAYGSWEYKSNLTSYHGCVGKNLERISVFPNGDCYICSFLFDHDISYAYIKDSVITKRVPSELECFYDTKAQCTKCSNKCGYDGCIAESINNGQMSCFDLGFFPVCRLWKKEVNIHQ